MRFELPNRENRVLIIHDISDEVFNEKLREKYPSGVIVGPDDPIKPCVGCLGCWLREPGKCVLNDNYCHMGKAVSECTEMIFISRCCYGSFSPFVKNVFDRSISYMLPLFRKKGRHSYHHRRYKNKIKCRAYFYSQDLTEEEKSAALELCKANAALWDCEKYDVFFLKNEKEFEGWAE